MKAAFGPEWLRSTGRSLPDEGAVFPGSPGADALAAGPQGAPDPS